MIKSILCEGVNHGFGLHVSSESIGGDSIALGGGGGGGAADMLSAEKQAGLLRDAEAAGPRLRLHGSHCTRIAREREREREREGERGREREREREGERERRSAARCGGVGVERPRLRLHGDGVEVVELPLVRQVRLPGRAGRVFFLGGGGGVDYRRKGMRAGEVIRARGGSRHGMQCEPGRQRLRPHTSKI